MRYTPSNCTPTYPLMTLMTHPQVAVLGPLLLARDVDASLTTPTTLSINEKSEKSDNQDGPFLVEVEEGLGEEKKTGAAEQTQDNKASTTVAVAGATTTTDGVLTSLPPSPPPSDKTPTPPSSSSSHHGREPVPITDPSLLTLAQAHDVFVDSNGEFDLTYREMMSHPSIWLLTLFFTTILTPGWGIKVGDPPCLYNIIFIYLCITTRALYWTLWLPCLCLLVTSRIVSSSSYSSSLPFATRLI